MKITFIGGGNMASAMIGGLLPQGWPRRAICAWSRSPRAARERLAREFAVKTVAPRSTPRAAAATASCSRSSRSRCARRAGACARMLATQLVITIAAGIRLADLARWLGGYRRLVRVMPNTPALVRAGISGALCARAT